MDATSETEAPTGPGQPPDSDAPPPVPITTAERLDSLERHMVTLRREMRSVQVEWEDYFERFRNLLSRLSRRDRREAAKDDGPTEPPINPAAAALLQSSRNGGK